MNHTSTLVRAWLFCVVAMCVSAIAAFAQNPPITPPIPPIRIEPIRITSSPVMTTVVGNPYRYQVTVSTASVGARVVYRLTAAPQGMTIDSTSGLISWTPSSAATVRVGVRVALATNASVNAMQQYGLNVLPASAAQARVRFTTTAPNVANVGLQYVYSVRAYFGVDTRLAPLPRFSPTITYSLVNAPQGMVLDATLGTIRWIPTTTGTVRFSIRAIASTVADVNVNNATQEVEVRVNQVMPQFFSQPPREAFVGIEYIYRAFATLPFVQPRPATGGVITLPVISPGLAQMTYTLVNAPQGMRIEATSGTVRWTPSSTAASVRVTIRANVLGNTTQSVTQDFTLSVRFPSVNFLTTPPTQAVLLQNYVYEPIAVVGNIATILPIPFPITTNAGITRPRSSSGLVFRLLEAPQGMSIDAASGIVCWTVSSVGTFRVSIQAVLATTPSITGTQVFTLRVNQPQARFTSQPGSAFVNTGEVFTYRATAIIPEMTTASLRYGLEMPQPGMTIDSLTGVVRWMPQVAGEFPITITVRLAGQTAVIARQTFPLYVRPVACAVLRGTVRYANTTATVNNATVRAVASSSSANVQNGGQLVYTATVRNGQFSVGVASGSYTIAVTGPDFNEVWWSNGIAPATSINSATPTTVNCRDTITRDISITRRAPARFFTLSGRVIRAANGAAVQATVEILGDAPPEIARETQRRTVRTDAQGNYRISLDDRFVYVVRALPETLTAAAQLMPQYFTGSSGGTLNLSEARRITLTADTPNINFFIADRTTYRNSLSGTVQSTSGRGIAGRIIAFMTATTASTPQYASIDIRTEAVSSSGTFSISNLTPGEYVLQAIPSDSREFGAAYYRAGTTATTLWRSATRINVSATSNERFVIVIPSRTSATRATATIDDNGVDLAQGSGTPSTPQAMPQTPPKQGVVTTSVRNQTPPVQMLSVAPNPAQGAVSVRLPAFKGDAHLEILSLRGEELFRAVLTPNLSEASFPLDVSALPNGMYIVRFFGAEARASAQILVNR